jgi:hypothetical protein
MSKNDQKAKAIHISLNRAIYGADTVVIEYKDESGVDRYMTRLDRDEDKGVHPFLMNYKPEGTIDREGPLIMLRDSSLKTISTLLLDMNPHSSFNPDRGIKWNGNAGKFADAALGSGKSFTFPNEFTVINHGVQSDGGLEMEIKFLSQPSTRQRKRAQVIE